MNHSNLKSCFEWFKLHLFVKLMLFILMSYICVKLEYYSVLHLYLPIPYIFKGNNYISFVYIDLPKLIPYFLFAFCIPIVYKNSFLVSLILPIFSFLLDIGITFNFSFYYIFSDNRPFTDAIITITLLKVLASILTVIISSWIFKKLKVKKDKVLSVTNATCM